MSLRLFGDISAAGEFLCELDGVELEKGGKSRWCVGDVGEECESVLCFI